MLVYQRVHVFHSATFYLSFHVFSSKSVIHLTYVLELWKLYRSVINNCSHFFCVHVQPVVTDECCYSCPDTALQAAQTRLALCCWAHWWIVGQLYQRLSSDVHYWLVVWHICNTFVIFPFSWKFHHPNWRTHIFQRGRYTTNQTTVWYTSGKCVAPFSVNLGNLRPSLYHFVSRIQQHMFCCCWGSIYREQTMSCPRAEYQNCREVNVRRRACPLNTCELCCVWCLISWVLLRCPCVLLFSSLLRGYINVVVWIRCHWELWVLALWPWVNSLQ